MVPGNPGYILDTETILRCQKADEVKIPGGAHFGGLPDYVETSLVKCINNMFGIDETVSG
jgi:hypothetical protein